MSLDDRNELTENVGAINHLVCRLNSFSIRIENMVFQYELLFWNWSYRFIDRYDQFQREPSFNLNKEFIWLTL